MGTWGDRSFENDAAGDWKDTLLDSEDEGPIVNALNAVTDLPSDECLEVDDAQSAVAAAEVVACLKGAKPSNLPSDVEEWVNSHGSVRTEELIPLALRAIDRVKTYSEESGEWYKEITDLEARLRG